MGLKRVAVGGICDDSITIAGVAAVRGANVVGTSGVVEEVGEDTKGIGEAEDVAIIDSVVGLQAAEMVIRRSNPTQLRVIDWPLTAKGVPLWYIDMCFLTIIESCPILDIACFISVDAA